MKNTLLLFCLLVVLFGCTESDVSPTLVITPIATAVEYLPPTFTPPKPFERFFPTHPVVTVTQPVIPTSPTDTPIPFGDTAVEVRYQIPALGLDRRLQGSISSQIVIVDETTGQAIKRSNQAGTLLELQQVLSDLLLPVVPEGCDTCVHVSYDLPFGNQHGDGWLRDPVLLASLDNFFTVSIGPHFPPGTILGLRRSASAFAPAHTIALMEDGRVYTWFASESDVSAPIQADPALFAALEALDLSGTQPQYVAPCPGAPIESLYLRQGEEDDIIGIICPDYALPSHLLSLYVRLDEILAGKLAESETALTPPPSGFPVAAMLNYKRVDGLQLTIFEDGTAVAVDSAENEFTTVLSTTDIISLTTNLIASGAVRTGLGTFNLDSTSTVTVTNGISTTVTATPKPPHTLLLLRGPGGVYDGEWFQTFDVPELLRLNELLMTLLNDESITELRETPELTQTPLPENDNTLATETPEPEATP